MEATPTGTFSGTAGAHYPVRVLLDVGKDMLDSIIEENCHIWETDEIPEYTLQVKRKSPGRSIDPDTPPPAEILKAAIFLRRKHLPGSLLGEWQHCLPQHVEVYEMSSSPQYQGEALQTTTYRMLTKDKKEATRSARSVFKTDDGLKEAWPKPQFDRPLVSPFTPPKKNVLVDAGKWTKRVPPKEVTMALELLHSNERVLSEERMALKEMISPKEMLFSEEPLPKLPVKPVPSKDMAPKSGVTTANEMLPSGFQTQLFTPKKTNLPEESVSQAYSTIAKSRDELIAEDDSGEEPVSRGTFVAHQ